MNGVPGTWWVAPPSLSSSSELPAISVDQLTPLCNSGRKKLEASASINIMGVGGRVVAVRGEWSKAEKEYGGTRVQPGDAASSV